MNRLLSQARKCYYSEKIKECGKDQKSLFQVTRQLLGEAKDIKLPSHKNSKQLADSFCNFFAEKTDKIRRNIRKLRNSQFPTKNETNDVVITELCTFTFVSSDHVKKTILAMAKKSCNLDAIPAWLLIESLDALLPIFTKIVNTSLEESIVIPVCLKQAHISAIIKKSGLDTENFANYRPVSNLSFISKLIEKVVAEQVETC